MIISPTTITIHLDPKFNSEQVWNFIFSEDNKTRINPLHVFDYKQAPPTLDKEQYIHSLRGSVLNEDLTINFDQNEFLKRSNQFCSAFKIKNKKINKFCNIAHCLLPKIEAEDNTLKIEWSVLEPALLFDLHYSKYDQHENFYISITINHALWGTRFQWLQAMDAIFKEMNGIDEIKKALSTQESFIQCLSKQANTITSLENDILDCEEARMFFWNLASKIVQKFAKSEQATHVTPWDLYRPRRNVDVIVYRMEKLSEKPIIIDNTDWLDIVWYELLSWNAPKELNEYAIRYWVNYKDENRFIEMYEPALAGNKSVWSSIVEIISKRTETDLMISELLNWTLDINWPGAGEAWEHLINKIGLRALPIIDKLALEATELADHRWEGILSVIKTEIEEKYKN